MNSIRYKAATVRWNCSVARCDHARMCRVRLLLLCLCVLVAMTLTLAASLSNYQTIEYDLPPKPPDLFKDKVRGLQTFSFNVFHFLVYFSVICRCVLEHNSLFFSIMWWKMVISLSLVVWPATVFQKTE